MFEWPRFAEHLSGRRAPDERVASLLAQLADPGHPSSAPEVLETFFDDPRLARTIARHAPWIDHAGFIAPGAIGIPALTEVLRASPFGARVRACKSVVVARELSSRAGRPVEVTLLQGDAATPAPRYAAVEIFVAALPAEELVEIVAQQVGCHVALGVATAAALEDSRDILRAHGFPEIPLMRGGPLTNHELGSTLLYIDAPGDGPPRRLEILTTR